MVMLLALVASAGAYAAVMTAYSQIRTSRLWRERTKARYLAEAALVIAQQRLWLSPGYCGGTVQVDTNGDQVGDTPVAVTVSNCGAGNRHEIRARVTY